MDPAYRAVEVQKKRVAKMFQLVPTDDARSDEAVTSE